MRPDTSGSGRPTRYLLALSTASSNSLAIVAARSSVRYPAARTRASSNSTVPSSTTAPSPYSGFRGAPTFRATITSSGAARRRAMGAATGTPPRGNARTMGRSPRYVSRRGASRSPASVRSLSITIPLRRGKRRAENTAADAARAEETFVTRSASRGRAARARARLAAPPGHGPPSPRRGRSRPRRVVRGTRRRNDRVVHG